MKSLCLLPSVRLCVLSVGYEILLGSAGVVFKKGLSIRLRAYRPQPALKDLNPPNSYKILGSGNSLVGFASGEAEVKLEDTDKGTNLIYSVEAQVGGKIAQVGGSCCVWMVDSI